MNTETKTKVKEVITTPETPTLNPAIEKAIALGISTPMKRMKEMKDGQATGREFQRFPGIVLSIAENDKIKLLDNENETPYYPCKVMWLTKDRPATKNKPARPSVLKTSSAITFNIEERDVILENIAEKIPTLLTSHKDEKTGRWFIQASHLEFIDNDLVDDDFDLDMDAIEVDRTPKEDIEPDDDNDTA